ncbi:hypothetical protein Tco_1017479 [Tanacetum coccineum]|uniref:Retrovirus-related Pol polyprotein from transposon TNT 1-94 n=1 Tax=Tanacetum coccineum TaxID=301880 RepID=A0ABQ5FS19_9ASTR
MNELNELRDQAYENSLIYKEKTKKIHDSKIKTRIFNVGDRVLLFNSRLKIFSGKLKTRWTGLFTIAQVFPYGTIELSQTDEPNFKEGYKARDDKTKPKRQKQARNGKACEGQPQSKPKTEKSKSSNSTILTVKNRSVMEEYYGLQSQPSDGRESPIKNVDDFEGDPSFEQANLSPYHAGCLDTCKSTSGGIQFLGGDKLVSWSSKKQDCTSMSSAEAEYVSLSACCAQVLWLRTQLTDYGFHFDKIPMYCDSKAAIAISCNPVQHSRTKHIDVRYHFIKEQVEKGIVELFFVGTEYQLADLFTKALPEDRFKYLVRRLGMRCLTPEELEVLANESA